MYMMNASCNLFTQLIILKTNFQDMRFKLQIYKWEIHIESDQILFKNGYELNRINIYIVYIYTNLQQINLKF